MSPDALAPHIRVQRTRHVADSLLNAGDIGQREYDAATSYRDDYELGLFGVSAPDRRGRGGGITDFMDVRMAATTRWREASRILAPEQRRLMELFFVEGFTYAHVGAEVGISFRTLKARTVAMLEHLARHYSGELYRPARQAAVSVEADVETVSKVRKPVDLDAVKLSVNAKLTAYAGRGLSPDRVAELLASEFGSMLDAALAPPSM